MKIMVINGSPKGDNSNTMQLTRAFLDGVTHAVRERGGEVEIETVQVSKQKIHPCLGCFSCWKATPGVCCLHDDMPQILEKRIAADVTVFSFPLYFFNVPGGMKNLIDRQLPMALPFMEDRKDGAGSGSHPSRYDMSGKRNVLISTCGFYSAEKNYDSVLSMFDHFCGKGNYETVFCGQGELFRVPELRGRCGQYLQLVEQAGSEFAFGHISKSTQEGLAKLLYPKETFEAMADASWGIEREPAVEEETPLTAQEREMLGFTRQMAALYHPERFDGTERVLEMHYTDPEFRCQMVLGAGKAEIDPACSRTATTTIHTPLEVWTAIARGERRGVDAMAEHLYRVEGDFTLMLRWDDFFGDGEETPAPTAEAKAKGSNMNILLLPWIAYWVAAPFHALIGSVVGLLAAVLVPLLFYRNRKTFYDVLTTALIGALAAAAFLGAPTAVLLPLSYFLFAAMWLLSCLTPIPLTAHYSMNEYGKEKALKNPIFLKTNLILTVMWGVTEALVGIVYALLHGSPYAALTTLATAAMGVFTVWFQRWYPAHVARGRKCQD